MYLIVSPPVWAASPGRPAVPFSWSGLRSGKLWLQCHWQFCRDSSWDSSSLSYYEFWCVGLQISQLQPVVLVGPEKQPGQTPNLGSIQAAYPADGLLQHHLESWGVGLSNGYWSVSQFSHQLALECPLGDRRLVLSLSGHVARGRPLQFLVPRPLGWACLWCGPCQQAVSWGKHSSDPLPVWWSPGKIPWNKCDVLGFYVVLWCRFYEFYVDVISYSYPKCNVSVANIFCRRRPEGPLHSHGRALILAWINNYIPC